MSDIQTPPPRPVFGLSLSDIRDAVRSDRRLQRRNREEMVSALNTAAAVLGQNLADIPADLDSLQRRLAEASPAERGIAPATWANVRSLVANAVTRINSTHPNRRTTKLDLAWQGWLHFCSMRAISPTAVDQSTLDAYVETLNHSLKLNSVAACRDTVAAWNRASRRIPGWRAGLSAAAVSETE